MRALLLRLFVGKALMPYLLLAGIAAFLAFGTSAYIKGRADANANCRAAELQAEVDRLKRDMNAWKAADAIEKMLDADLEAERDELEQKVVDYELELLARPDSRCVLNDDDLRMLNR